MNERVLNPEAKPYSVYADCPPSEECDYCPEGAEFAAGHVHEMYERREGASHRTADELVDVFLDAVEFYAAPWRRSEGCPRDVAGWCEDPDDAEALMDEMQIAEGVLFDVGLSVEWDDGFVIERISEKVPS